MTIPTMHLFQRILQCKDFNQKDRQVFPYLRTLKMFPIRSCTDMIQEFT